jgi:8-oxo-dGTP diphosphatase
MTLNGPGGKREGSETLVACAIRETFEELEIILDPEQLQKISTIIFHVAGVPDFRVTVFYSNQHTGTPHETDDMIPGWYDIGNLPYDQMLEGDRKWFEKAARGEKFNANVYYKSRAKDFEQIEFFPFED